MAFGAVLGDLHRTVQRAVQQGVGAERGAVRLVHRVSPWASSYVERVCTEPTMARVR